jgi:hypothetical protein
MNRAVTRIAAAVLLAAALAPAWASASPVPAPSRAPGALAAPQSAWEPLARFWSWLTGSAMRTDSGPSSDPLGRAAARPGDARTRPPVRPDSGPSIDPLG